MRHLVATIAAVTVLACRTPAVDTTARRSAGAPLWSVETGLAPTRDTGPAVGVDGTVFVGGSMDLATGEPAGGGVGWKQRQPALLAFDAEGRLRTKVLGSKPRDWIASTVEVWVTLAPWGTAYAVDRAAGIYAIFPNGGTTFCQAPVKYLWGPPVVGPGGRLYSGGPGGLRGLDAQALDNPVGFFFDLGGSGAFDPVVSADGRLYFGSTSGGRLYALDAGGQVAWSRRSEGGQIDLDPDGNPIIALRKTLTAYHPNGEHRWTFEASSNLGPPVVGPDGTAYVCSETGLVHALDTLGRERWSFALDGPVASSPTLGSDGTLYVTSQAGTLYALDGEGRKRFNLALPPGAGRVAVAADGRVYCVGGDLRLHAFAAP